MFESKLSEDATIEGRPSSAHTDSLQQLAAKRDLREILLNSHKFVDNLVSKQRPEPVHYVNIVIQCTFGTSGTPLMWTPWGPGEVYILYREVSSFQGEIYIKKAYLELSLIQRYPYFRGVPLYIECTCT